MDPHDSAFPRPYNTGLSKREYAIIQILAAVMVNPEGWGHDQMINSAISLTDKLFNKLNTEEKKNE